MALRAGQSEPDGYPAPVEVHIGAEWVSATAHAERVSRQGHQVLITYHGRLMWVAAHRIRPRADDGHEARSVRVEPV